MKRVVSKYFSQKIFLTSVAPCASTRATPMRSFTDKPNFVNLLSGHVLDGDDAVSSRVLLLVHLDVRPADLADRVDVAAAAPDDARDGRARHRHLLGARHRRVFPVATADTRVNDHPVPESSVGRKNQCHVFCIHEHDMFVATDEYALTFWSLLSSLRPCVGHA